MVNFDLLEFQSPSHRGMLFNDQHRAQQRGDQHISIPSSPGTPIQQRQSCSTASRTQDFNPLRIGERFSTRYRQSRPHRLTVFHSPSHRGALLNRSSKLLISNSLPSISTLIFSQSLFLLKTPAGLRKIAFIIAPFKRYLHNNFGTRIRHSAT